MTSRRFSPSAALFALVIAPSGCGSSGAADMAPSDGGTTLVDGGSDGAVTHRQPRALLLDQELRDRGTWIDVIDALTAAGLTVDDRRFFPHLTAADVEADPKTGTFPYELIVLAAGRVPGTPSSTMRFGEVALAEQFVRGGGVLLLAPESGQMDVSPGDNEWFLFNRVLEDLGVLLRIDHDTIVGEAFVGMPAPPHVASPVGYPTALEMEIGYPYLATSMGHPTAARAATIAGGSTPTLTIGDNTIEVLLSSHGGVDLWVNSGGDPNDQVIPEMFARAVGAAARVDNGFLVVIPRAPLTLSASSGTLSDEPVLDLASRDANRFFVEDLFTWLHALATGAAQYHSTDAVFTDDVYSVSAPGFPVSSDGGTVEPAHSAINVKPLPAAPPAGDLLDSAATTPLTTQAPPSWFGKGGGRIGYGGYPPDPTMMSVAFQEAATHHVDALMVTTQPERLSSYTGMQLATEQARYATVAAAAKAANVKWFIGGYVTGSLWADNPSAYPSEIGAEGQAIAAPSYVDANFWTNVMMPACVNAGNLAKVNPGISGLHLDAELYNGPIVHSDAMAFSNTTISAFIATHPAGVDGDTLMALDASERLDWLVDHGLLKTYFTALETIVRGYATKCRQAAEANAPNLEFMVYLASMPDSWFYRGLLGGLGTPAKPVIVLTYQAWADRAAGELNAEGISFVPVGGVIVGYFKPTDFATALTTLAGGSDGYWYYTFNDFSASNPTPPALYGPSASYFNAIDTANTTISH